MEREFYVVYEWKQKANESVKSVWTERKRMKAHGKTSWVAEMLVYTLFLLITITLFIYIHVPTILYIIRRKRERALLYTSWKLLPSSSSP